MTVENAEKLAEDLLEEFQEVFDRYSQAFGHTFTAVGLHPGVDAFYDAIDQMENALDGSRSEPVTNESIGLEGEFG